MSRLINANFMRLFKGKIFWVSTAVTLVMCVPNAVQSAINAHVPLEKFYFDFVPNISILCAAFISLFFAREYSDGTIRNKIICGHSRTEIYFANLLTSVFVCATFYILGALSNLTVVPLCGFFSCELSVVAIYLALGFLLTAALSSVLTLMAMLITGARSGMITLMHVLVLLIVSSSFYNMLCEPEMTSSMTISADGVVQPAPPEPNPNYIDGFLRDIFEFIVDLTPEGQSVLIADLSAARPLRMVICSCCVIVLSIIIGLFFFKRKDVK